MRLKNITREQAGYLFLLAVMLVGSAMLLWSERSVSAKVASAEEEARPADVELTLVVVPDCPDCFRLDGIAEALGSGPLNILKRETVAYDSEEGKALVEEYGIATVPTLVIRGEIGKRNAEEFLKDATELKKDARVWSTIPPVFVDASTGTAFGRVKMTIIDDATCKECYEPLGFADILKNNYGVRIAETLSLDRYSAEGRSLVEAYGIKGLPAIILSSDTLAYKQLVGVWPGVGTIENDGTFVFRGLDQMNYTYRDLETGQIIQPVTNQ